MSSTHAPEHPRPFDRIPNELLTEILLNLNPPQLITSTRRNSSDNRYLHEDNPLFRVRLVSKQVHAVCQPILHRDLEIETFADSVAGLNELVFKVEASPERAAACRTLHILDCGRDSQYISLRKWAQLLPDVERLTVSPDGDIDAIFDQIATFDKLRYLSISLSRVRRPSGPLKAGARFNFLESLHVSRVDILRDGRRFETASFPALRRLRVTNGLPMRGHHLLNLFPLDLLSQLECVDIDGEAALKYGYKDWFNVDDLPRELPVLWRLNSERSEFQQAALPSDLQRAVYLRLYHSPRRPVSSRAARDELHSLLDTYRSLRLVLVSELFLSAASSPPEEGREPILAECERRGLEIRSYNSALDHEALVPSQFVAPEFVAFVREKAASARSATAARQS